MGRILQPSFSPQLVIRAAGGATVTALVAEDPSWAAAVALDPWWYALPPETAALSGWRTRVPLMMQPR